MSIFSAVTYNDNDVANRIEALLPIGFIILYYTLGFIVIYKCYPIGIIIVSYNELLDMVFLNVFFEF